MPPAIRRAGLGCQRLTAGDELGCAVPTTTVTTTERVKEPQERAAACTCLVATAFRPATLNPASTRSADRAGFAEPFITNYQLAITVTVHLIDFCLARRNQNRGPRRIVNDGEPLSALSP